MPKSLPEGALSIWDKVFDKAKTDGDSEETAAKKAWGAIKRAGWEKGEDGKWSKKSLTEFSLNVKKASIDKGEMRWRADTSDVDADLYDDNMSLELFRDFINRIESDELAPEEFRSDFWQGGTPYVSVSHYNDMNGDAVPGTVDAVYVDGKFLKARGKFYDTPLGKACFYALQEDLQKIKATSKYHDGRVRVSIAFLDWMHKHKSSGYVFERKSLDDICPECLMELLKGEKSSGKTYLKGQLVHLALTRVPVNTRTIMEVDRAMTTRKEDAASIIGDELAGELEEKAKTAVKKAALVEFSDAETPSEEVPAEPLVENMMEKKEEDEEEESEEEGKKKGKKKESEEYKAVLDAISELSSKISELSVAKSVVTVPAEHPLDGAIAQLKSAYDNVVRLDASSEDKLKMFQPTFDDFANGIIRSIQPQESDVVESNESGSVDSMVQALSVVMQPLAEKLELISTKLESRATPVADRPAIPERRSIPASALNAAVVQQKAQSITPNLRALIEKTTQ